MGKTFTLSRYNYLIERDENIYWFNAISRGYFIVNKPLSEKLVSICNTDVALLRQGSPRLCEKMIDEGFLVDSRINEVDIVREKHRQAVEAKDYMMLILPTLNCNYQCWYCVQDHLDTKMSEKTAEKLKNHIDFMIHEEKITSLHLEWFGGEPFMYFWEVIEPITLYAKAQCEAANIPFSVTATTNAYYLTEGIHTKLDELGFSHFQITLDGIRDVHNKVKFSEGLDSAFDRTLRNIDGMLSTSSKIKITLRINYTAENLNEQIVEQVNAIIHPKNRNRIKVYFRKVWQEETDRNRSNIVNALLNRFQESGYYVQVLDITGDFTACYTDQRYYNAINYNGHVLKCTASGDLYRKIPLGKLQENGSILWQDGFLERFHVPGFENGICTKCKQLPLCMGPCRKSLDEEFVCKNNATDRSVEERIVSYIEMTEKSLTSVK